VSHWGSDSRAYKALGNIAVAVEPQAELLLFNYTARATYENTWNAVEVVSRGLIVHWPSAQLAALPFPKFFNVGQRPETAIDMLGAHPSPVEVTSKLDGSLGILYRPPDGFAIATRGSFTSTQALWATQHLRAHCDLSALPDDVILLFEIVYPNNPEGADSALWRDGRPLSDRRAAVRWPRHHVRRTAHAQRPVRLPAHTIGRRG
jgi:hypothetical protein